MKRILFVCMGNICRSPTAEGVSFNIIKNNKIEHILNVDSAGTHSYHVGEPPDPRTCAAAMKRGIDLSGLRARRVVPEDFERFDLLLAMDHDNLKYLKRWARPEHHGKLDLGTSEQVAIVRGDALICTSMAKNYRGIGRFFLEWRDPLGHFPLTGHTAPLGL